MKKKHCTIDELSRQFQQLSAAACLKINAGRDHCDNAGIPPDGASKIKFKPCRKA